MAELNTKINIDAGGNFSRQMRQYEKNWTRFSKTGQRQMGVLRRSVGSLGNGLDRLGNRYTAILAGAGTAATFKGVLDFDARLTQLGTQANKSKEEVNELRKLLLDTANDKNIRLSPEELLAGVEKTVEKVGDLDLVEANIRNIGLAMRASGAAGEDMGALLADLSEKMDVEGPKAIMESLDVLVRQGEMGAFTLANLAQHGAMATSAYSSLGRTGPAAVREMGTLLQIAQKATGEPAKAATAFERLLSEMISKSGDLRKNGIEIWDLEEQQRTGKKVARSAIDIVKEIIVKTNGDIEKIQTVFGDEAIRPLKFLASQYQQTGDLSFMDKFNEVQGDGSEILKDAAANAETAAAALNSLYIAYKRFADDNLAEPIQALADAINGIDKDTLDTLIKGAAGLVAVGGTAIFARKLYKGGQGLSDLIKGSKGKSGGTGLGGMMDGVTPVYVVNMGGGKGMGGMGAGKKGGFKPARKLGRWESARAMRNVKNIPKLGLGATSLAGGAVLGAGAAGYGAGTMIYDNAVAGTDAADVIGRSIAKALAFFGNDNAQAALAAEQKAQQQTRSSLEIEVTDKRVQVKSIQSDDMDISVDTGVVMP
ncbi:hypothetical protein [uncultured Methylophaga sp.]|uniref:hypothetical protein n=1 Tax=uncultured Methylophaga sp. TaxID=285271 RepID=UPI0026359BB6|nr:hypothetical protein [uncultured Methylophaga sp.]